MFESRNDPYSNYGMTENTHFQGGAPSGNGVTAPQGPSAAASYPAQQQKFYPSATAQSYQAQAGNGSAAYLPSEGMNCNGNGYGMGGNPSAELQHATPLNASAPSYQPSYQQPPQQQYSNQYQGMYGGGQQQQQQFNPYAQQQQDQGAFQGYDEASYQQQQMLALQQQQQQQASLAGGQGEAGVDFATLGVSPHLCSLLARAGFNAPFPIQALVIPDALQGRDVCGKAKTGSGKTLAFGIPILQNIQRAFQKGSPSALVLVPTRELALQVKEVLATVRTGYTIELAYGGSENRRGQMHALFRRPVDILVACPGRLIDFCESNVVRINAVRVLVLDEADRMAEMGFQEQVDKILQFMGEGPRQTMLFSATLDSSVDVLVKRHMSHPLYKTVREREVTVDLMTHRFLMLVNRRDKIPVCAALSCLEGIEKVLIFVRTKVGTDDLATALKRNFGIGAMAIHGDKTQTAREKSLMAFDKGGLHCLVATDVAARGLDISRVDLVIHYDAPEGADAHKQYLHRSGRTARAGKGGLVCTLVDKATQAEVDKIRRMLNISYPMTRVFAKDLSRMPMMLSLSDSLGITNYAARWNILPKVDEWNLAQQQQRMAAMGMGNNGMGTSPTDLIGGGGAGFGGMAMMNPATSGLMGGGNGLGGGGGGYGNGGANVGGRGFGGGRGAGNGFGGGFGGRGGGAVGGSNPMFGGRGGSAGLGRGFGGLGDNNTNGTNHSYAPQQQAFSVADQMSRSENGLTNYPSLGQQQQQPPQFQSTQARLGGKVESQNQLGLLAVAAAQAAAQAAAAAGQSQAPPQQQQQMPTSTINGGIASYLRQQQHLAQSANNNTQHQGFSTDRAQYGGGQTAPQEAYAAYSHHPQQQQQLPMSQGNSQQQQQQQSQLSPELMARMMMLQAAAAAGNGGGAAGGTGAGAGAGGAFRPSTAATPAQLQAALARGYYSAAAAAAGNGSLMTAEQGQYGQQLNQQQFQVQQQPSAGWAPRGTDADDGYDDGPLE